MSNCDHEARRGKVTASRVADDTARTKTGWGASRHNYMAKLVAERLTGTTADSFQSAAMQWGIENEPKARAAYEFYYQDVNDAEFVDHPRIDMAGASPDGLVGDNGLVEIKCPNTATHIEILLGAPIDRKYIVQMQWQMACTNRQWCDFVSFDPRLPEEMALHVRRVHRDDKHIGQLEADVETFLEELEQKVIDLQRKYQTETV